VLLARRCSAVSVLDLFLWQTRAIGARKKLLGILRGLVLSRRHPESVIAWIIIGAIAGWLAGLLVKGYGFGLIGNIVIGILGAGIAGILAPRLGLYTASTRLAPLQA
jgi:uncharacterized membrane protein YeaQ/YmgE (transglycosylase-associated protein family)